VACWSTKAAIALKRVKVEQNLLWRAYIGTHQRSFGWYHSRPPMPPFPRLWIRNPDPKLQSLFSGSGKATDFKFGSYIHGVHRNENSLKILDKRERGRIQGLHNFFWYPLLSQEGVKLRTSNVVRTFMGSIGTKAY